MGEEENQKPPRHIALFVYPTDDLEAIKAYEVLARAMASLALDQMDVNLTSLENDYIEEEEEGI